MSSLLRSVPGLLAAGLVACAATTQSAERCAQRAPDPPKSAVAVSPAAPAQKAILTIVLTPKPTPAPHVEVKLSFLVEPGVDATAWTMSSALANAIGQTFMATDADGPLGVSTKDTGKTRRAILARAPRDRVDVTYSVPAHEPAYPSPPPVAVDPDRFEGAGDALLIVPDALEDHPVAMSIRIDASAIGASQYTDAASSFGVGSTRSVVARGSELSRATFVAGNIGKATFDAPEGHDESMWLGYTAFDPRPASADMAGVRTAVRQILKTRDSEPATLLFLSDTRPLGAFVVTRRARSVLVRTGIAEPWSGPVRIAATVAILHEWIGDRLWIGPADPARAAESYWFSEGVVRDLAREMLFRFGLVTPAEDAAEVEGLEAIVATSPLSKLDNAELARRASEPGATPLLVARGALYAARVDALLAKKSGPKRTLEDVVAALYAKGSEAKTPLPTSAWVDAITAELGAAEGAAFEDLIGRGKSIDLPEGALGPCFARVTKTYAAFDLGFDQTEADGAHVIRGLDPKGPAARAGIAEGDKLVSVTAKDGHAEIPAVVVVDRAGVAKTFRYAPAGATVRGQGWARKRDVSDDACTK